MENEIDSKAELYFGALLHDIGKIIYRSSSCNQTHSELGAEFLENEVGKKNPSFSSIEGQRVIEQVRYHHAKEISGANNLDASSLVYITYFADNISAGIDRKNEGDKAESTYFDKKVQLDKIFNILKGNSDHNKVELPDYDAIRKRLVQQLLKTEISSKK